VTKQGEQIACVVCGRPARVTVVGEAASPWHYCMECADKRGQLAPPVAKGMLAFVPGVLIRGGALLGVLTLAADFLHIAGMRGFGWKQVAGTEAGILIVAVGAFLRQGLLTVGGTLLVVLSLGADYLEIGRGQHGVGWRKQAAIAVSIGCVIIGLLLQRRAARQAARDTDTKG
jgi:hypothetical protein